MTRVNRSERMAFVSFFVVLLSACSLLPSGAFASAALKSERTEFTLGFHFESRGGMSSAQTLDIANTLLQVVVKDYGYSWKIISLPSDDAVMEALLKNQVDGALLWPEQAVETILRGGSFYPWATFTMGDRPRIANCLWTLKSVGANSPSDIIGKTYLTDHYWPMKLIELRGLLLSMGIDKPLWRVFSSFVRVPAGNSAFMAIAMGKADFYMENDDNVFSLKIMNPGVASKLSHPFCTDPIYSRGTIVFNKKTVDRKTLDKFSAMLKNFLDNKFDAYMKSRPEMRSLSSYARMARMKFSAADPDTFMAELALYKKAKARNWLPEMDFIVRKMDAVVLGQATVIKPDYKYCKLFCKGYKIKCISSCMD